MIELITKSVVNPRDIIERILSGKIHVVCIAQNGLTHLNVYGELYCKVPRDIINKFCDEVNSSKKAATFFPEANISILPKSERQTDWNRNQSVISNKEFNSYLSGLKY